MVGVNTGDGSGMPRLAAKENGFYFSIIASRCGGTTDKISVVWFGGFESLTRLVVFGVMFPPQDCGDLRQSANPRSEKSI
jgi:hypothetical protein